MIRMGMIGCGHRVRGYLTRCRTHDRYDVTTMVDLDEEAARGFAQQFAPRGGGEPARIGF